MTHTFIHSRKLQLLRNRRAWLGIFLSLPAALLSRVSAAERPNVVIIDADDKCYATGPRYQETPRIPAFYKAFLPVSWR
jgi:hypothetical protein